MKRVGITQRVVFVEKIKERRDSLDQRWYLFAEEVGIELIPIPNQPQNVLDFARSLDLEGLIFSGGNNIGINKGHKVAGLTLEKDDVAYERDDAESLLLEWAVQHNKPLVGVCRGMEFIHVVFGGGLFPVEKQKHVAVQHNIDTVTEPFRKFYGNSINVNSFHSWGIKKSSVSDKLVAGALDGDNYVEAFRHRDYPIFGIMWHPERYDSVRSEDKLFFKRILNHPN